MKLKQPIKVLLIAAIYLSTTGFLSISSIFKDDVYGDTEDYIDGVKRQTKPSAELVGLKEKELTPYIPYRLVNEDSDPFEVKSFVLEVGQDMAAVDTDECPENGCGDGAPTPHAPYFLENYSLDQLMMTGTLSNQRKRKVALIQTPDAGIVYATVGEYIGRNNGLIMLIERERMIIQEKYRTSQGWQNRNAILPLIRN